MSARRLLCFCLVTCLWGAHPAQGAMAQSSDAPLSPEVRRQAGQHFTRGIELFDEGRFEAALAEFQRAYEIAPTAEALYNLGRVFAELGRAVEATDAFERYLAENAGRLGRARLREARMRLERQRSRIGSLRVESNVVGAVITVDAADRGVTPLTEPIPVAAGLHTLVVRAPGHDELRKEVRVAGGQELNVPVELRPLDRRDGTLRIVSVLADVHVLLDGAEVGRTPLERTLVVVAGRHTIRGHRPGYDAFETTVTVDEGAESIVDLRLQRARNPRADEVGRVALPLPDAPARVAVDGESIELRDGEHPELPVGVHQLRIEVAEREPYEATIEVPPGETLRLAIALEWEPDSLERRLREAKSARIGRWAMVITGGLLVGGAGGLSFWNEREIRTTDAEIIAMNEKCDPTGPGCSPTEIERGRELEAKRDAQDVLRAVGYGGGAIALGVAITGLILVANTPSDSKIRASASAGLTVLPTLGGVILRGEF